MTESKREASTAPAIDVGSGAPTPAGRVGEWMLSPFARHAATANIYGSQAFGEPGLSGPELMPALFKFAKQAEGGDLSLASHVLMAQALTLDSIFTELARRSAFNLNEHTDAAERHMRLALKAQANSRATIETLAKLHQPREQTVKHVHVNQGGQAVVADQFHHHHGGQENETDEQPHAPSDTNGLRPPLLGQDEKRDAVPMPSHQRKKALSASRRTRQRRAPR